jgi:aminoglycoside phosphotransferase (APT) family kinase protein
LDARVVDTHRLAAFIRAHGDFTDVPDNVQVAPISGGQSNLTFIVDVGERKVVLRKVVLRRPPEGPLPPSAHDVLREFKVLSGLHLSPVPVPRPLLACDDISIIGAPFYLMEYVSGRTIRHDVPEEYAEPDRRGISDEFVDALTVLHRCHPEPLGLANLGRPVGYLARQLGRWRGQLEYARTRPTHDIDWLTEWLERHLPPEEGPGAIVHGDYRLENVIFSSTAPAKLLAIVDWELSTLGDPLTDVGYMLANWREPGDAPLEIHTFGRAPEQSGFLSRAELIERYVEGIGRPATNLNYYVVFSLWKMAIFFEGHWARQARGTAGEFDFAHLEMGVPAFAARARLTAQTAHL